MSNILDSEPSSFQEATNQQVWRDAMVEDYTSIMKNDVRGIVHVIAQFVLGCKGKVKEDKLTQWETILSLSPQQEVSFYLGW
jgi:hypothetical protein